MPLPIIGKRFTTSSLPHVLETHLLSLHCFLQAGALFGDDQPLCCPTDLASDLISDLPDLELPELDLNELDADGFFGELKWYGEQATGLPVRSSHLPSSTSSSFHCCSTYILTYPPNPSPHQLKKLLLAPPNSQQSYEHRVGGSVRCRVPPAERARLPLPFKVRRVCAHSRLLLAVGSTWLSAFFSSLPICALSCPPHLGLTPPTTPPHKQTLDTMVLCRSNPLVSTPCAGHGSEIPDSTAAHGANTAEQTMVSLRCPLAQSELYAQLRKAMGRPMSTTKGGRTGKKPGPRLFGDHDYCQAFNAALCSAAVAPVAVPFTPIVATGTVGVSQPSQAPLETGPTCGTMVDADVQSEWSDVRRCIHRCSSSAHYNLDNDEKVGKERRPKGDPYCLRPSGPGELGVVLKGTGHICSTPTLCSYSSHQQGDVTSDGESRVESAGPGEPSSWPGSACGSARQGTHQYSPQPNPACKVVSSAGRHPRCVVVFSAHRYRPVLTCSGAKEHLTKIVAFIAETIAGSTQNFSSGGVRAPLAWNVAHAQGLAHPTVDDFDPLDSKSKYDTMDFDSLLREAQGSLRR
uniref:Uncharacterized protein n=1 Tax=Eptatretus burgeri TaxID=7764 RepID=A0A8C4QG70_EPTBU